MALSNELISQFAKLTKNTTPAPKESTVYGTAVEYDGRMYVKIDGSDRLTPASTIADLKNDERVVVTIKDHTATVTGNISSPSASSKDLTAVGGEVVQFGMVMAHKITANDLDVINATIERLKATAGKFKELEAVVAEIETLKSTFAQFEYVSADEVKILNAAIDHLEAEFGKFTTISAEDMTVINADISQLKGYTADFTYVNADVLNAMKAVINEIEVKKLNADAADLKYVNIDFTNIDKAQMNEFYAKSGLIEKVVMGDGTVTGYLVGVTIKGDLIEGNTIKADKLVVLGEDGLYYKLNFEGGKFTEGEEVPTDSLHGSIITAKSITATQISVQDLVAFGATIGGFHIGDEDENDSRAGSIYSGAKSDVSNSTRGIFMDTDGQFNFGDSNNFIKFYKDEEGNYKLEISAESILFGANSKSSAEDLRALTEHVKIRTYTDPETGNTQPCVELSEGDTNFKQIITNTATMFADGDKVKTKLDTDGMETENVTVTKEFRQGGFVWTTHGKGNYGLMWKG